VVGLPKKADNVEIRRKTSLGKFLNKSMQYSISYKKLAAQFGPKVFESSWFFGLS
jgi:hypothetical protein